MSLLRKSWNGNYVDDILAIGPPRKLDEAEIGIEGTVELDKRGKPEKMLGIELTCTNPAEFNRDSSGDLPQNRESWRTVLATLKSGVLRVQPRELNRLKGVPKASRSATIRHENDETRDRHPRQPLREAIGTTYLKAGLGILRHLSSTSNEGIILRKPKNLNLKAYADASYGGEGAGSQSGTVMMVGDQIVGWSSGRQDIVSLSITKVEYIADAEGAKDLAWA